jgi:muconate cycloisomerase
MRFTFHKVSLKKRFPLAISRGVRYDSYNLFVSYEKDGHIGWGEAAPGNSEGAATPEAVQEALEKIYCDWNRGIFYSSVI